MKQKKAFTLIELMVAMGIIGVLMTMSILGISIVQSSLRNTQRRDAVNSMNLAINTYFSNFGIFPSATGSTGVVFTTTTMSINGTKVLDLKGPTTADALKTDDSHTQYCYRSTGGSYGLGAKIEGATGASFDIQLGNDGSPCQTALNPS
ncbi:MAG: type II secretion system protein [Candidatus Dojkabacteria bacterium]